MRTTEIRQKIAKLERELVDIEAERVAAATAGDDKAFSKLGRRASDVRGDITTYREAMTPAEAREEEDRKARRVAMVQTAGEFLLSEATEKLPAAVRELAAAVAVLGEKLAKLHDVRDRMMSAAAVALEHSRADTGDAYAAVMSDVGLSALAYPLVRALERAGLGERGIVCGNALQLAPVGPVVSLAEAAEKVADKVAMRVADLTKN